MGGVVNMKSVICLFLLLQFVLFPPFGPAFCADTPPAPTIPLTSETTAHRLYIEIPQPAHDLGTVTADREFEHTFTFRNTGTAVLEIDKVVVG